jgi:dTDP-4-dehydrorhamnose reductase
LGEVVNSIDLTLRTSIIGPELKKEGEGLFDWFMNQTGSVSGYKNVYWSGVTTLELARAIDQAITQNLSGLYHVSQPEKISKYDLLFLIKKTWEKHDVEILPSEGKHSDKSLICTRKDFDYRIQNYEKMLLDLFRFMKTNTELYSGKLY